MRVYKRRWFGEFDKIGRTRYHGEMKSASRMFDSMLNIRNCSELEYLSQDLDREAELVSVMNQPMSLLMH